MIFFLLLIILLITLIIIASWLAKKTLEILVINSSKIKTLYTVVGTIIYSTLLLASFIGAFWYVLFYYSEKEFNQFEWERNIEIRYKMSKYIIENKFLIGKTKAEVIELLGNKECRMEEYKITYYLGHVPELFNIDPDVLVIEFKNGMVIKVTQYQS